MCWASAMAQTPQPRALTSVTSSVWDHPAAAAEQKAPSGMLRYGNYDGHQGDFSFYLPINNHTAGYLGYANPGAFHFGSVIQLYSGTWVGARGELSQYQSNQYLDFSLGAYYRPNQHMALSWDTRRLLESVPVHSQSPHQRLFGMGGALFFDQKEWVALYGDLALPGFSGSDLSNYQTTGGLRIRIGDTLRIVLDCGLFSHPWEESDLRAIDAFWSLGLGVPIYQHRLDATFGAENYAVKGPDHKPSLRLGLGFVYQALRDRTPPVGHVLLQLDSNSQGVGHFQLNAQDNSTHIQDWQLLMHHTDSSFTPQFLVKRYTGQGAPPATLFFDRKSLRGEPLPAGLYAYRLLLRDPSGNGAYSSWEFVELP